MCRTIDETSTNSFTERDFLMKIRKSGDFSRGDKKNQTIRAQRLVHSVCSTHLEAMLTVCVAARSSSMSGRTKALGLYRSLLRESNKVTHYNMREYSLRSVRTRFRENLRESKTNTLARHLSLIRFCFHYLIDNSKKVNELLADGERQLAMLKRQASLSQLYPAGQNIVQVPHATILGGKR